MRGQVSIEFLTIMILAVVFLVSMLAIGAMKITEAADEARKVTVENIAYSIQQELLTANTVHDGYTRNFFLPVDVQKRTYVISMRNATNASVVTISSRNVVYTVGGPLCTGFLQPGTNRIQKINETIYCNP